MKLDEYEALASDICTVMPTHLGFPEWTAKVQRVDNTQVSHEHKGWNPDLLIHVFSPIRKSEGRGISDTAGVWRYEIEDSDEELCIKSTVFKIRKVIDQIHEFAKLNDAEYILA